MTLCSRCGNQTSIWQRGLFSGICRNCRNADAANEPYSLSKLTRAGWLLTLATIALIVGLMLPYGGWLYGLLPKGRYPEQVVALPVLLVGLAFFAVGSLVLKWLGVPVWKQRDQEGGKPPDQPGG
jgi:MFS family permease